MTEYPTWKVDFEAADWQEQSKRHAEQAAQWWIEQGMMYHGFSEVGTADPHKLVGFDASMTFATDAEADAAFALFPKFVKVRRSSCSFSGGVSRPTISIRIWFSADGVNKGKNETGQKRMAKFLSIACATFKMTYNGGNVANGVDVLLLAEVS